MLTKSTLIVAVVAATIGIASFAQSFSKSWGTGNELTYYDHEQNAFRDGGALRPLPAIWLDCSNSRPAQGPRGECTWH